MAPGLKAKRAPDNVGIVVTGNRDTYVAAADRILQAEGYTVRHYRLKAGPGGQGIQVQGHKETAANLTGV